MKLQDLRLQQQDQKGFTLVELAVVMIIIGLLIGGVLQGQQLIENARVTNVVSTLKAYEVAQTTFLDAYNGTPGDLNGAGDRLPNCTGLCGQDGNGNNVIDSVIGGGGVASQIGFPGFDPAGEMQSYFLHLAAAGMVEGVDTSIAAEGTIFGESYPANPLGGGLHVGYFNGNAASFDTTNWPGAVITANSAPPRGTYIVMVDQAGAVPNNAATALSPGMAARLDIKLDDGSPGTGNVRSLGGNGANTCTSAEDDVTAVYNSANESLLCNLAIRVQG